MTFAEAKAWKMPFGKHKGFTLDVVAQTDDGLRYLDWLRGADELWPDARVAINAYLDDPSISKELGDMK